MTNLARKASKMEEWEEVTPETSSRLFSEVEWVVVDGKVVKEKVKTWFMQLRPLWNNFTMVPLGSLQ